MCELQLVFPSEGTMAVSIGPGLGNSHFWMSALSVSDRVTYHTTAASMTGLIRWIFISQ